MAWTNPVTWTAGQVVSASDLNAQIRDNMNYVLSGRGLINAWFASGTNYTVGVQTTFVAVDATNLKFTVNTSSGRLIGGWLIPMVAFDDTPHTGSAFISTQLNGATNDAGTTSGGFAYDRNKILGVYVPVYIPFEFQSVPAGSNTYQLVWRDTGAAGALIQIPLNIGGIRAVGWEI